MKEVTEEEYTQFKEDQKVNSKHMKVTEEFPDGSYSVMYHLGYNRSINMCCVLYCARIKSISYYIF